LHVGYLRLHANTQNMQHLQLFHSKWGTRKSLAHTFIRTSMALLNFNNCLVLFSLPITSMCTWTNLVKLKMEALLSSEKLKRRKHVHTASIRVLTTKGVGVVCGGHWPTWPVVTCPDYVKLFITYSDVH